MKLKMANRIEEKAEVEREHRKSSFRLENCMHFFTLCFQRESIFFTALLLFCVVPAEAQRSLKALSTQLKNDTFTAELAVGFHFNDKAPNGIQVGTTLIKPTSLLPQLMTVSSLDSASQKKGIAQLYVCDDKVTFCESYSIPLSTKSKAIKNKQVAQKIGRVNSHGFLVDDFEAALKQAQQDNKFILLDFGARWCPACIRLESTIFNREDFKEKTKLFVKAKIDIDVFSNSVVKEKYKVRGVPSVVFLNAQGDEVSRFYDYQPMSFVDEVLADIQTFPKSIAEMEKSESSEALQKSLAIRYFYSGQYEKAEVLMSKIKPEMKEFWFAKIEAARPLDAKDPVQRKKIIETLRFALQAEPESTRSLAWRSALAEFLESKADLQIIARESDELTEKILSSDEFLKKAVQTDIVGEYTGYEGFYVAMMNAETLDAAQWNAKRAWLRVIEQGKRYNVTGKTPGISLRLVSAMMNAEEYEKALALVDELLKESPSDGDLQRRKLRVLVELKRYKEARSDGEKALKNSYGINQFYVVEPLAKAYVGLGKKNEARKLVNKFLARNEIHFASMSGWKEKFEKFLKANSL